MIDWSKLSFTKDEIADTGMIVLKPDQITDDHIIMHAHWFDKEGREVRKDVHLEILKPLEAIAQTGE